MHRRSDVVRQIPSVATVCQHQPPGVDCGVERAGRPRPAGVALGRLGAAVAKLDQKPAAPATTPRLADRGIRTNPADHARRPSRCSVSVRPRADAPRTPRPAPPPPNRDRPASTTADRRTASPPTAPAAQNTSQTPKITSPQRISRYLRTRVVYIMDSFFTTSDNCRNRRGRNKFLRAGVRPATPLICQVHRRAQGHVRGRTDLPHTGRARRADCPAHLLGAPRVGAVETGAVGHHDHRDPGRGLRTRRRGKRPPESLYGSLKMWAHLQRQGIPVARRTVERIMRANDWRGVMRARRAPRTQ